MFSSSEKRCNLIIITMVFVYLVFLTKVQAKRKNKSSAKVERAKNVENQLQDFDLAELAIAKDFIEKAGYKDLGIVPSTKPGSYVTPWNGLKGYDVKWDKNIMFFEFRNHSYFANGEFMIKLSDNISISSENAAGLDKAILSLERFYCEWRLAKVNLLEVWFESQKELLYENVKPLEVDDEERDNVKNQSLIALDRIQSFTRKLFKHQTFGLNNVTNISYWTEEYGYDKETFKFRNKSKNTNKKFNVPSSQGDNKPLIATPLTSAASWLTTKPTIVANLSVTNVKKLTRFDGTTITPSSFKDQFSSGQQIDFVTTSSFNAQENVKSYQTAAKLVLEAKNAAAESLEKSIKIVIIIMTLTIFLGYGN